MAAVSDRLHRSAKIYSVKAGWTKADTDLTVAPFCKSISVIAFPIPCAAPVTTAILPFKAMSPVQIREKEEVSCRIPRKYI